ncbi:MAG: phosphotransferase [Spirochaetes bacterium]|jgi:homoserine kinase type II|nr:phosphotransferase [Spirochaetota bacterium]
MPAIKSDIKRILREDYGIKALAVEKIKVGVINSNYIVNSDSGDYLFKIYNLHNDREVRFELNILEFLGGYNFPCPRIIRNTRGGLLVKYSGRPVVLLSFIPGRMALEPPPDVMRTVGVLAGRLHKLLRNFKQPVKIFTWEPADIGRLIRTESENIIKKKYPDAENFVGFIAGQFKQMKFPGTLPVGMTHQDIKPENIIVDDKGKISFIDFNNCYRGVLIYDAMTTVIWSCFRNGDLREDLFSQYILGYNESRPFTGIEKEYCFDALRFRLLRETFVWPMRFKPGVAREKGEPFLLSYRNLMKHEGLYKKLILEIL